MILNHFNFLFIRPDRERIKVIGAERACAEWLLRCGGAVKWDKGARWLRDYNSLPSEGQKFFPHIQEVLLDGASVMDVGFEHFGEFYSSHV